MSVIAPAKVWDLWTPPRQVGAMSLTGLGGFWRDPRRPCHRRRGRLQRLQWLPGVGFAFVVASTRRSKLSAASVGRRGQPARLTSRPRIGLAFNVAMTIRLPASMPWLPPAPRRRCRASEVQSGSREWRAPTTPCGGKGRIWFAIKNPLKPLDEHGGDLALQNADRSCALP